MSLVPHLAAFAATLLALLALSRWITRQVQLLGLRVTGSSTAAVMGYYLLMFPGILLHELSHFLTARLLGLRVGKFSLGPRRRGDYVELGSVSIASGGALRDSLVGLAPFVTGTAVLLAVSYLVFDVNTLGQAWVSAGWDGVLQTGGYLWQVPDLWVWAYVIFVVSNAMTPSPSDRRPWLVAGIYLAVALAIFIVLGGLPWLAAVLREQVLGTLQALTLGFLFTVVLNLIVAAVLGIAGALLGSAPQVR